MNTKSMRFEVIDSRGFSNPWLRKVAAAIGRNCVETYGWHCWLPAGVCTDAKGHHGTCGRSEADSCHPSRKTAHLSDKGACRCHHCHALLFEYLGLGPQLFWVLWDGFPIHSEMTLEASLWMEIHWAVVMDSENSWWWQLGFILTFSLETDLIRRDGALVTCHLLRTSPV